MDTVRQRAERIGLRVYDTALPQSWFDQVLDSTSISPYGQFVWCYDAPTHTWGRPVPLTEEAGRLLASLPFELRLQQPELVDAAIAAARDADRADSYDSYMREWEYRHREKRLGHA